MTRFRSAKKQAEHAIRQKLSIGQARHGNRKDQKIHSLGTKRNYEQALIRITQWIQENRLGDLKNLTSEMAIDYLELRGQSVGQKILDQERHAMQLHLGLKLPVIKSELDQALTSRAYTKEQVELIIQSQNVRNSLATKIALAAGLRACELLTLLPKEERSASSHRQWSDLRFNGKAGKIYTVKGKGGLIREVLIPNSLAIELESKRYAKLITVKDREIAYQQHYDIAGGKAWSNSFSAASKRALGWSNGAHGMRHSYAQERLEELLRNNLYYIDALGIVSQELGHFRPSITQDSYLR